MFVFDLKGLTGGNKIIGGGGVVRDLESNRESIKVGPGLLELTYIHYIRTPRILPILASMYAPSL